MKYTVLATLLAFAVAPCAMAGQPVVILLPFSNVSGSTEASEWSGRFISSELAERGWSVAPGDEVERLLEEHRVRYLDSIPTTTLEALVTRFGASAVVAGSIVAYRENGDPSVALAARMFDDRGEAVWGEFVALSASESEGALGLGRRATARLLLDEVAAQLMRRVPKPSSDGSPTVREGRLARGSAWGGTGPQTYRSPEHPRGRKLRICVLPFTSPIPAAGRLMMEILTVRLEATGEFDVVEPAELREGMRRAGLRSVSTMTSTHLAALGEKLGTPLFLRGNVHAWREAAGGRSEVQIDMTLVDVAEGTILWAVTHQRRGSDYAGLLGRGTVNSIVALADNVVSEALESQHRTRPREHRSNRPVSRSGNER
jgi:TolB-like protein